MIVNAGLNLIRSWLAGEAPNPPSHMAVGTGITAVAAENTALQTEVVRKAIAAQTRSATGVLEYIATLASTDGNGSNLSEVGILNAVSAGTLLLRKTHTAYAKTASFSVKYVIRHTQTNI